MDQRGASRLYWIELNHIISECANMSVLDQRKNNGLDQEDKIKQSREDYRKKS